MRARHWLNLRYEVKSIDIPNLLVLGYAFNTMPKYSRSLKIPGKTAQELYSKLSEDIEKFVARASFGKVDISRNSDLKQLCVKSSMVKATLVCEEGLLQVEADLSLFAAPFRSKIDDGIDKWLSRTFPASS